MKSGSTEISNDSLRARIRQAGLRITAPRVAVLRRLVLAERPVSHADLVEALSDDGFDRATLYRNLVDLTDAGLVTRTDLGDHVWRFELRRESDGEDGLHPHFTCTDCGNVECLPDVSVEITTTGEAHRSLRDRGLQIQLKGRCDACA